MIEKKISMKNVRLSNFAELVSYLSTSQGIHNRVGKVEMHNFNDINDLNFAVYDALRVQDYNKTAKSDKTYHLLVSFANGEDLSDEQLTKIEQSMIDALGFTEHQRISVVHRDTDNLHFHVAINKIHPEKFTIHEPHRDFKILGEQCKKFEIEFSLKQLERGKGNKLGIDMEEMSGLESMIGWARRNVSESIKNAQSWEQVNQILNEHGFDLKKRGNGFVIGNGEIFVKASSIDREFSKAKLETKLGTYPYDKNGDVTYPKKTEYKKKPYSKRDTSQLYAEYQQSRSEFEEQRNYEINTLKLAKNKEISDIKAKFNLRFALAKATKGQSKRFLMKVLILQMRAEIKNSQKKYKGESQKIYKNYKNRTWADWLKKEAISGNERALQALRGRGKEAVYKGNQFKGEQVDNFENLRIDTVTKKGTVIYEQDNYTIRDTGKSLRLGAIPEPKAVEKALEIAIKKYGKRLDISGTKEFQEKVAKIAAAKGLDVEFSNPVINNHFNQYQKEYEYARAKSRRTESINGVGSGFKRGNDSSEYIGNQSGSRSKPDRYSRDVAGRDGRLYGAVFSREIEKLTNIGIPGVGEVKQAAGRSNGMRGMSERSLVFEQRRAEMLLPGNVSHNMGKQGSANDSAMRWPIYRARGELEGKRIIENRESVVGLVAKPGVKPPAFRRENLQSLSSLQTLFPSKKTDVVSERPKETPVKLLDPIQKYINERENKRKKGFDIMKHRRYNSSDFGIFEFRGIRVVDGQPLGLFKVKEQEEIVILNLTEYTRRRLSNVSLGADVTIAKNGQVRVSKGRKI